MRPLFYVSVMLLSACVPVSSTPLEETSPVPPSGEESLTIEELCDPDDADSDFVEHHNPGNGALHRVYQGESIQVAIDLADDGDAIMVLPGTYVENLDFQGKEVYLYAACEAETVLDGGGVGTVVRLPHSPGIHAAVRGFIIRNGHGGTGGGVYVTGEAQILDNQILNNHAEVAGGGIYATGHASKDASISGPTLSGNIVVSNTTDGDGGGVALVNYFGVLSGGQVHDNTATTSGGGIYIASGQPVGFSATVEEVSVSGNIASAEMAPGGGGGIYLAGQLIEEDYDWAFSPWFWEWPYDIEIVDTEGRCRGSTARLLNNTVDGNSAVYQGGGILSWCSEIIAEGNLVSGNVSGDGGGGVALMRSKSTLSGNEITGNVAGTTSDISGGGNVAVVLSSSTTFEGDVISNGSVAGFSMGGGLIALGCNVEINAGCGVTSELVMDAVTVEDNTADQGGGVFAGSVILEVTGSTFTGNDSSYTGGGLGTYLAGVSVQDSVIQDNRSEDGGGMEFQYSYLVEISGNAFIGNEATDDGGHLQLAGTSGPVFGNSFDGGVAGDKGGAVSVFSDAHPMDQDGLAWERRDTPTCEVEEGNTYGAVTPNVPDDIRFFGETFCD